MALIWRGIFEVDDEAFASGAGAQIESWLRWKLRDNTIELPHDGSLVHHASGCEITGRTATDGDLWGLRAALFEHRDEEQIRTTVTAARDGDGAWVWIDLERWSADAFVEPWIPIAPGVVSTMLREAPCHRGPSRLAHEAELSPAMTASCWPSACLMPVVSSRTWSCLRHGRNATAKCNRCWNERPSSTAG
jgi:hypothetical protein